MSEVHRPLSSQTISCAVEVYVFDEFLEKSAAKYFVFFDGDLIQLHRHDHKGNTASKCNFFFEFRISIRSSKLCCDLFVELLSSLPAMPDEPKNVASCSQ